MKVIVIVTAYCLKSSSVTPDIELKAVVNEDTKSTEKIALKSRLRLIIMKVNNGGILSNRYKQAQTSVSDETSWNPISMFKQPNNLALIIFAAILIPVVIVIGIIVYFIKRRQKKRGFGKTMGLTPPS